MSAGQDADASMRSTPSFPGLLQAIVDKEILLQPSPDLLSSYHSPTEDQRAKSVNAIHQLSSAITTLESHIQSLKDLISQNASISRSPIRSLPNELLATIFSNHPSPISIPNPWNIGHKETECKAPRKAALALVCRRWRDIVYQTPTLWTNIVYDAARYYRTGHLRNRARITVDLIDHIRFSKDLPVLVNLSAWTDPSDYPASHLLEEPLIPESHEALRATSARWETLKVRSGDIETLTQQNLLPTNLPTLTRLKITNKLGAFSSSVRSNSHFEAIHMPQLSHVTLYGTVSSSDTTIRCTHPSISHITHLRVVAPAELPVIYDYLVHAKRLESLDVQGDQLKPSVDVLQSTASSINSSDSSNRDIVKTHDVLNLESVVKLNICAGPTSFGHLLRLIKCTNLETMIFRIPFAFQKHPDGGDTADSVSGDETTTSDGPLNLDFDQEELSFCYDNIFSFIRRSMCSSSLRKLVLSNIPFATMFSMLKALPFVEELTYIHILDNTDMGNVKEAGRLLESLTIESSEDQCPEPLELDVSESSVSELGDVDEASDASSTIGQDDFADLPPLPQSPESVASDLGSANDIELTGIPDAAPIDLDVPEDAEGDEGSGSIQEDETSSSLPPSPSPSPPPSILHPPRPTRESRPLVVPNMTHFRFGVRSKTNSKNDRLRTALDTLTPQFSAMCLSRLSEQNYEHILDPSGKLDSWDSISPYKNITISPLTFVRIETGFRPPPNLIETIEKIRRQAIERHVNDFHISIDYATGSSRPPFLRMYTRYIDN